MPAIKNGYLVTAGSTAEQQYIISDIVNINSNGTELAIEVVSSAGGIQFSVQDAIDANHALWVTGAKIIITVPWNKTFRVKATNSADTWRVTA